MLPKADLRSLEWILRRVEKLSPESRRWLIARMSADYINGKHQPLIDGSASRLQEAGRQADESSIHPLSW